MCGCNVHGSGYATVLAGSLGRHLGSAAWVADKFQRTISGHLDGGGEVLLCIA